DTAKFEQRLALVPEELKPLVLAMYAKPFHRKTEINTNSCEH
ncbi:acyltransferase, partial [Pseudoalteromonas aurantia]